MLLGTRVVAVILFIAGIFTLGISPAQAQSQAQGGFMDSATSNGLRPRLSAGEIQTFLPQRGTFTFPAPYQTTGIRLTNAGDCGGQDCVLPVGYSYWKNINNHAGSDTMYVFLGLRGQGPTLFSYNKSTGETRNLGPLFAPGSSYSGATGEGWYFSGTQATKLYVNDGGPAILRYDIHSRAVETVFDVREHLGSDKRLWQVHSSNDDRVHSATVKDASYAAIGCVAYNEGTRKASFFPRRGDYDECQIDKSGRWLLIKENLDGRNNEDNLIIDLQTGAEQIFRDEEGAAGHSDLGYGYLVAEDNWADRAGALKVWQFGQPMNAAGQGTLVYGLVGWPSVMMHVTHGNAKPGTPINQQMACASSVHRENHPRVNEIICYRLDGSLDTLVVAPNLTDLNASGGGSDEYSKAPKGNIDPTGEYFIWTSNAGTGRLDAFIVRIPQHKLGVAPGAPSPSPAPAPAPSPAPDPAPSPAPAPAPAPEPAPAPAPTPPTSTGGVSWMSLINVSANGSTLQKTSGCGGCPDASAVSEQQISGSGVLQFVAPESGTLRFVGLASGGIGTGAGDINFAIRLQSGVAEVRESGSYRTETSFAAGDTFQIMVEGGAVRYAKNGALFHTSGSQAGFAMRAHAVFFDMSSAVSNVAIQGGSSSAASAPAVSAPTTPQPRIAQPRPPGQVPVRRKR